jgi:hypothetical protein
MAANADGSSLVKGPLSTEPALLTRMAIGPRACSAALTCRFTSSASVTSAIAQPAADHRHPGACARQRGSDGAADAASATSDESMLAVERHGVGFRRRLFAGEANTLCLKFQSFNLVREIF